MERKFVFEAGSDTVRLLPQNYCVLVRQNKFTHWVMDSDGGIPMDLAVEIFKVIMYEKNDFVAFKFAPGDVVVERLNRLFKIGLLPLNEFDKITS